MVGIAQRRAVVSIIVVVERTDCGFEGLVLITQLEAHLLLDFLEELGVLLSEVVVHVVVRDFSVGLVDHPQSYQHVDGVVDPPLDVLEDRDLAVGGVLLVAALPRLVIFGGSRNFHSDLSAIIVFEIVEHLEDVVRDLGPRHDDHLVPVDLRLLFQELLHHAEPPYAVHDGLSDGEQFLALGEDLLLRGGGLLDELLLLLLKFGHLWLNLLESPDILRTIRGGLGSAGKLLLHLLGREGLVRDFFEDDVKLVHILVEDGVRLLAFQSQFILGLLFVMGAHYGIFCHICGNNSINICYNKDFLIYLMWFESINNEAKMVERIKYYKN